MKVAIQGEEGSFHHQVVKEWFEDDGVIVPRATFADTFAALQTGDADMVVTAVENTLYGSINDVLDLLETYRFPIVGEVFLAVEQQLTGLPSANNITKIYSHPVALAQCEHFLDTYYPNAERIEYSDTAAAVKFIKSQNDPHFAAIAGKAAAELYDLPIIAADIEDNRANFTRFLILTPQEKIVKNADKASLILATNHAPGALARVLSLFAGASANLTKLQSRPIVGQPWKYRFYLDVEISPETLAKLTPEIQKDGNEITVLGHYKAASL